MPELANVATVQSYIGDSTADPALILLAINAAEARIAKLCGRHDEVGGNHWLSGTHTERIDGEIAQHVLLRWTPITAVASVDITTGATTTQSIALTNLELDGIALASLSASSPGTVGRLGWRMSASTSAQWFDYGYPQPTWMWSTGYPNFSDGRSRVVVAYTGGYASAPADLAQAAVILAANIFERRLRGPGLTSQRLGDFAQTYGQSGEESDPGGFLDLISSRLRMTA